MTDAELQQQSAAVVEGEWIGQAPWPGRTDGQQLGKIAVIRTLSGAVAYPKVLVLRPPAGKPISSTDLNFHPGDRGLWFLKAAPGESPPIFTIDHPQRSLLDVPENAKAIQAWRERLRR